MNNESIERKALTVEQEKSINKDFILEATERAEEALSYYRDDMNNADEAMDFLYGNHYGDDELQQRDEDNRVSLVFNRLPQFVNKVIGSHRTSVATIKIEQGDSSGIERNAKMQDNNEDELDEADVYTDLMREIQYKSNATKHYGVAFKHAVEGGFGYLRVLTNYEKRGFQQEIKIKSIRDRWSVLIDPRAVEPDKSDMMYAFISSKISLAEFRAKYPNATTGSISNRVEQSKYWICGLDEVIVTEYFRRVPVTKTIVQMTTGEVYDLDDIKDSLGELEKNGIRVVRQRDVDDYKVMWSLITISGTIEDEREFGTSTIPIVPILGREYDFNGRRRVKGLVADGIDAQIAINKVKSATVERADSAPLNPWVATKEAISGFEDMYKDANTTRFDTLFYNKGEDRPHRGGGVQISQGEVQLAGILDQDIMINVGVPQSSLGRTSNETSGKAIRARQEEADVGLYEFFDNYNTAIERIGRLVVELIPKIYNTERTLTLRAADGTTKTIVVNKLERDVQNGGIAIQNNLRLNADLSVIVTTGASYSTKKEQNAEQILDLMRVNPSIAQIGSDLLVKNLDFGDSDTLSSRLEKSIPMNLLSKEKREQIQADMPQDNQPSPEQVQANMEMDKLKLEGQIKELELKSKESIETTRLEIEKVRLEIAKTNLEKKEEDEINSEADAVIAQME